MKRSILSIINKTSILVLLIGICGLNACDDNGMGDPLATKLKMESSSYDISISKTAIADTVVATIRWIDIKSSYTLTLSNSVNNNTVDLSGNDKGADNNVRLITFTDKQLLAYLTQMQLSGDQTAVLTLTIAGTRTDGKADEVSATINIEY
jgi:hypothetical protein